MLGPPSPCSFLFYTKTWQYLKGVLWAQFCSLFMLHCVKSVRIRSYCGPHFPAFGLKTEQNNSKYGHFSRNVSDITQPKNAQTTTLSQFAYDIALWAYGRTSTVFQHKIQKHLDEVVQCLEKIKCIKKKRHPIMNCSIKTGNKVSWCFIWL